LVNFTAKSFIHKCELLLKLAFHAVESAIQTFVHFFTSVSQKRQINRGRTSIKSFQLFLKSSLLFPSSISPIEQIELTFVGGFFVSFLANLQKYQSFKNIFGMHFYKIYKFYRMILV